MKKWENQLQEKVRELENFKKTAETVLERNPKSNKNSEFQKMLEDEPDDLEETDITEFNENDEFEDDKNEHKIDRNPQGTTGIRLIKGSGGV